MVEMIVVDNHRAIGAEQLDAIGLPQRRIAERKCVADTEAEHGPVVHGDNRPVDIVGRISRLLENARLPTRYHLNRAAALEEPEHQIDEVSDHVVDGRSVWIGCTYRICMVLSVMT